MDIVTGVIGVKCLLLYLQSTERNVLRSTCCRLDWGRTDRGFDDRKVFGTTGRLNPSLSRYPVPTLNFRSSQTITELRRNGLIIIIKNSNTLLSCLLTYQIPVCGSWFQEDKSRRGFSTTSQDAYKCFPICKGTLEFSLTFRVLPLRYRQSLPVW